MVLRATVENRGAAPIGAGLAVTFYVGTRAGAHRAVGTARTTGALVPGASDAVSVSFTPEPGELSMIQASFSGSAPASGDTAAYVGYVRIPRADVSPDQARLGSRPERAPERLRLSLRALRYFDTATLP
jgi:hypothetical protein